MPVPNKQLPDYSPLLDAYHAAFATELKAMIAELPFASGDRVLDMGCGDGTYTGWIAERIAPEGRVTAVDFSAAYLRRAKQKLQRAPFYNRIRFVTGNIKKLPFPSNTFDGAWCAQSFFSFPDPAQALKELTRVVRPGGLVAILEDDAFHQTLLPWPIDVELTVYNALHRAYQQKRNDLQKACVGRNLRQMFVDAGLRPQRKRLHASQRETPLSVHDQRYLRLYLKNIRETILPFLSREEKSCVEQSLNPRSETYVPYLPELTVTCLDHLICGKKR